MTHRSDERAVRAEARDVVAEAEATLSGNLVGWRWWSDDAVAWVWVNTLAHAGWSHLNELAAGGWRSQGQAWDAALAFLAGELLIQAGRPEGLVAVQRLVLVPLELEMLGGLTVTPRTAAGLVSLVRSQLALARSRQAHPSAQRLWPPHDQ